MGLAQARPNNNNLESSCFTLFLCLHIVPHLEVRLSKYKTVLIMISGAKKWEENGPRKATWYSHFCWHILQLVSKITTGKTFVLGHLIASFQTFPLDLQRFKCRHVFFLYLRKCSSPDVDLSWSLNQLINSAWFLNVHLIPCCSGYKQIIACKWSQLGKLVSVDWGAATEKQPLWKTNRRGCYKLATKQRICMAVCSRVWSLLPRSVGWGSEILLKARCPWSSN